MTPIKSDKKHDEILTQKLYTKRFDSLAVHLKNEFIRLNHRLKKCIRSNS